MRRAGRSATIMGFHSEEVVMASSDEAKAELREQFIDLERRVRALENELRNALPPDKFQLVQELARLVQSIQAKLMRLLE